ncbi:MAG: endopeptidase La [Lachnospiraceae bacterium]|nr:endopeptidase La [Lachnospiraceae bacterium]
MNYPVVALRGLVVLPGMMLHFDVNRPKSIAAVRRAMVQDQMVFLTMQRDENDEEPGFEDLWHYGTLGKIKQLMRMPNKITRVLVEGVQRAELMDLQEDGTFLSGEIEERPVEVTPFSEIEKEAMVRTLREQIEDYAREDTKFADNALRPLMEIEPLEDLLAQLMIRFPATPEGKQKFLQLDSTHMQFSVLTQLMSREIEITALKRDLQMRVKERIDKNQREYMLREQIKVIREELGEGELDSDIDCYQEKADALQAPQEVKDTLKKEISRLRIMPHGSQEGTVSRTYIETLLAMPWNTVSLDSKDIRRAERILEEDHYGLEKIKERILEYLAVRIFSDNANGSILCLVGPPGTGKTSIARSVARALDKRYIRVSLGGVHDEAEIRGHRRTYIGAMPGRIAAGMKQAGVSNPLMLLDEIDKVSSDYKGDTASALLEVLDSEQNMRFVDHYIEIPMDLSRVMFIATANNAATIPRPLLDRMDIIEVSSYTENEKFHIAKDYLIEKQRKKNGLSSEQFTVSDEAIRKIIHNYTREAGVRNLERRIGDLCRKATRALLEDPEKQCVSVETDDLVTWLGKEKVNFDSANEKDDVGIVRGLAWTSVGGDTLQIEVNVMPGKGAIQLTGQMGDVMKESARAGLSYIRSIAHDYEIKNSWFDKHDIHIHIPEGAVPKDGPSAGITMATGMLSAITGKAVRADVAMTGEITLRGRVLPIGGLKEKLLAAKMAGIREVLVPEKNRPDIDELSEEITGGLTITYCNRMEQVIGRAFAK